MISYLVDGVIIFKQCNNSNGALQGKEYLIKDLQKAKHIKEIHFLFISITEQKPAWYNFY